jgi:hypothetical protein
MELVPRGLALAGPGATGVPLLDCILCDPGLAGVLFSHLAPADVLGLRASCKAACAAVAEHAWDGVPLDLCDPRFIGSGGSLCCSSDVQFNRNYVVNGRAALHHWRACFPAARAVVSRRGIPGDEPVIDADIEPLAGVTRFGLQSFGGNVAPVLADDALVAPDRPQSALETLHLDGIDVGDGLFAQLPRLTDVEIARAPRLSDAAFDGDALLEYLTVICCS